MAAQISPMLQELSSRNQDAISNLLRGAMQPDDPELQIAAIGTASFDFGVASPAVRWMAGVFLADELTSLVRVRDGASEGQIETALFVDAKWRRQGFGTLLLDATMDWAFRHQADTLRLVCARTNWPIRHFARKFGARLDLVLGQLVADIPLDRRLHGHPRASSPG